MTNGEGSHRYSNLGRRCWTESLDVKNNCSSSKASRSVPSTRTEWVTTTCNSSTRSDVCLWPPHICGIHSYTHTHISQNKSLSCCVCSCVWWYTRVHVSVEARGQRICFSDTSNFLLTRDLFQAWNSPSRPSRPANEPQGYLPSCGMTNEFHHGYYFHLGPGKQSTLPNQL